MKASSQAINIAIDGYSSCGKSTLARELAAGLGMIYIDTGAMYRAITLHALRNGWASKDFVNEQAIIGALDKISVGFRYNGGTSCILLNGSDVEEAIRSLEVSQNVSQVSAIAEVRQFLHNLQMSMAIEGGVVMDGRDIGTAVMPDAALKIFMTADPEIRAVRRYDELTAKGIETTLSAVKQNIEQRDYIDTTRKANPLTKAADARVLDNTHLNQEEQLQLAIKWAEKTIAELK